MADNGEPDSVCRQGPLVKVKVGRSLSLSIEIYVSKQPVLRG